MTDKGTSGQSVQKSPELTEGLFLMDGIEGLRSLPRHSVDTVSYTHLGHTVTESMKNDIAVAQRLGITATTLEGILTVKGQGRR